jgi:hypothetical protein
MLIIGAIVTLFLIFQTYAVMSTNKSESQLYKVVRSEGDFEIRFYPAVVMATITSTVKTYKELGNSGFRKLANYIFGGNQEKKQIGMTSPVHMDITDSLSSMSFVMPEKYTEATLPVPKDENVHISKSTAQYVAVITFNGYATDEKIKEQQIVSMIIKM